MSKTGSILVVCVAFSSLIGCSKQDPRQAKLVGTWRQKSNGTIMTLRADGTYSADVTIPAAKLFEPPISAHVSGTWSVDHGNFVYDIQTSSYKSDRVVGKDGSEHLMDVESDGFTTTDNNTQKDISYLRVNP